MKISNLITALVGAVIGLALLPVVSSSVAIASECASSTISALLSVIPILYVVVIVGGMVAYVAVSKD